MVTPEVQVHEPDGTTTVSPVAAKFIAACTSAVLQEAAVRVAAFAMVPKSAHKRSAKMLFVILFSESIVSCLDRAAGLSKVRRTFITIVWWANCVAWAEPALANAASRRQRRECARGLLSRDG